MDERKFFSHTHCPICGKTCITDKEADMCFESHTEIDALRYMVYGLYFGLVLMDDKWAKKSRKYFDKAFGNNSYTREQLVKIVKLYDVQDPEEYYESQMSETYIQSYNDYNGRVMVLSKIMTLANLSEPEGEEVYNKVLDIAKSTGKTILQVLEEIVAEIVHGKELMATIDRLNNL